MLLGRLMAKMSLDGMTFIKHSLNIVAKSTTWFAHFLAMRISDERNEVWMGGWVDG